MRPVNLLPQQERAVKPAEGLGGSSIVLLGVLGALLLAVLGFVVTQNQVNGRSGDIAKAEAEAQQAEQRASSLGAFGSFAAVKQQREQSVRELAIARFDWERFMRELALVLPSGTSLIDVAATTDGTESGTPGAAATPAPAPAAGADGATATATAAPAAGPKAEITGCAVSQSRVATLMLRLGKLAGATDVELKESAAEDTAGGASRRAVGRCRRRRQHRLPGGQVQVRRERDLRPRRDLRQGRQAAQDAGPAGWRGMTLTERDRKIAIVLVPLVVMAAYWFLVLAPKREEAAKLGERLSQAQTTRDTATTTARAARGLQELLREGLRDRGPARQGHSGDAGHAQPAGAARERLEGHRHPLQQRARGRPQRISGAPGAHHGGPARAAMPRRAARRPPPARATRPSRPTMPPRPRTRPTRLPAPARRPATAAGSAATTADGSTSGNPGLDSVPLEFTFSGSFFDLADFFHRMKRFVRVANKDIRVQGRLMTIDGLTFKSDSFPVIKAEVRSTVYLSPKSQGTTAGATPQGPGTDGTTQASTPGTAPAAPGAPVAQNTGDAR